MAYINGKEILFSADVAMGTQVEVVQETGDSETQVMSQKATTEMIGDFTERSESINLIDPTTIVDNSFWKDADPASGSYSRTEKIAVKPDTAYTFANTDSNYWDSAVKARFITYFDESGERISYIENATNFTTPSNCYYVAISFKANARNVILVKGTYDTTKQTMVFVPYVPEKTMIDRNAVKGISVENIVDFAISGKNLFNAETAVVGMFLNTYPGLIENASSFVSDYIKVEANKSYVVSHSQRYTDIDVALRSYVLYDSQYQKVSSYKNEEKTCVITPTVDGYLRFCGYKNKMNVTQLEVGSVPTYFEAYRTVMSDKAMLNAKQIQQIANVLFGKKWVPLGDSFTATTDTQFTEGRFFGRDKTYPYLIAERNNMDLVVTFFEGGRTMAYPSDGTFTNSVTCPTANCYYQNIPEDADIITIMLGINDCGHSGSGTTVDGEDATGVITLGTIDDTDTSTYYGAYNAVLGWLRENRPFAHIGIIVTNGNTYHKDYTTAQIELAKKWGYPYINLNGDERTPAMIRSSNENISDELKEIIRRKQAWDYDGSITGTVNNHPNAAAHEYESYFIENWLRSL